MCEYYVIPRLQWSYKKRLIHATLKYLEPRVAPEGIISREVNNFSELYNEIGAFIGALMIFRIASMKSLILFLKINSATVFRGPKAACLALKHL
jgi:hypothetical protein